MPTNLQCLIFRQTKHQMFTSSKYTVGGQIGQNTQTPQKMPYLFKYMHKWGPASNTLQSTQKTIYRKLHKAGIFWRGHRSKTIWSEKYWCFYIMTLSMYLIIINSLNLLFTLLCRHACDAFTLSVPVVKVCILIKASIRGHIVTPHTKYLHLQVMKVCERNSDWSKWSSFSTSNFSLSKTPETEAPANRSKYNQSKS